MLEMLIPLFLLDDNILKAEVKLCEIEATKKTQPENGLTKFLVLPG